MDFTFSKGDAGNTRTEADGEKKSQRAILLLLLLLVAGFSYLYFCTGIIKPQETPRPAEIPVKSQMVKMPLPPQPTDADPGKTVTIPADSKKEPVTTAKPLTPQTPQTPKTAIPPATPAVAPPAAKNPAPPPSRPKEEPKKVDPVKPREEPKKVAAGKTVDTKPAVVEKKPASARPETKQTVAAPAPKPKKIVSAEKPVKAGERGTDSGNTWSIQVGTYVLEDALSIDMGRLRKAGLEPVITSGVRKKLVMNRLYLAEYTDRADAMSSLEKLKRHTSDAFILDQGGKHAVYAGSYLLDARAGSEMERLNAAGFKVSMKRADVAIPSRSLSLGPFNDKKAADAALNKLKAAGMKAVISKQ